MRSLILALILPASVLAQEVRIPAEGSGKFIAIPEVDCGCQPHTQAAPLPSVNVTVNVQATAQAEAKAEVKAPPAPAPKPKPKVVVKPAPKQEVCGCK